MTISVSKPAYGRLNLGLVKIIFDTEQYNVTKVLSLANYYKGGTRQTKLRERIVVRTNNLTNVYDTSGHPPGTRRTYYTRYDITDFNFPDTPSPCILVQGITQVTGSNVIYGGGSGKTRIVVLINRTASNATISFTTEEGTFSITDFYPGEIISVLLVNTPAGEEIVLGTSSLNIVDYFVVETDTSRANTDTYTISYEELDDSDNIVDSGTDTGTFYWFFLTVQPSSIVYGGGGARQP